MLASWPDSSRKIYYKACGSIELNFIWYSQHMKIEKYDISLDVNFSGHSYSGDETITTEGESDSLLLNVSGPVIDGIELDGAKAQFQKGSKNDEVIVKGKFGKKSSLKIRFHAEASKTLMGLYLAKAVDGSEMLTTQFESTGARMAFPCVDDPSWKAVFALTVKVDDGLDVISNMPAKKVEASKGKKVYVFRETPRMSTYLLYLGIGKFETRAGKYKDKDVYLSGLANNLDSTDFPITVGKQSLEFFDSYFGIDYALPKMHLISVPEFGAGAMENWGAITFRETALLVNKNTSEITKKRVASVIAHEIAHQWFGDLVTMKWWNDLWLNESFATFMMYKMVEKYYPDWYITGEMMLTRAAGAFNDDSLQKTHPIDVDVKDPETVAQIFDQISYGKGGMILRMIEKYAGYQEFREGIQSYLTTFSYQNATGADLWKSIEKTSGKPISKVMEAWIKRPGYPYVSVKLNGQRLHLEQKRFLLDGTQSQETWPIPLTLKRKGKEEALLMEAEHLDLDAHDFVKLNADESGFYRVLYDEALYENMLSNMKSMSYLDRWGIVSDMFAFLVSGKLDFEKYAHYLSKFNGDQDNTVVQEVSSQYQQLYLLDYRNKKLVDLGTKFYRTQLERLGSMRKGESVNDTILRGTLSTRLAMMDPGFALELSKKFDTMEEEVPDMRGAIALAAALNSSDVRKLADKLAKVKSDEDRVKIISAMGHVKGEESYNFVTKLIDDGKIKKQDITSYFSSLGAEPANRDLAFKVLPEIVKRMSSVFVGTATPSRLIFGVTPYIGLGRTKEMQELLKKISTTLLERGIAQGLESLAINEKLLRALRAGS